jgi:hypothetical protein
VAPRVIKFLAATEFPIRLRRNLVPPNDVPLADYDIPDNRSSIEKATKADAVLNYLGGTWLNRGDLYFLALLIPQADSVLGPSWIEKHIESLRNPEKHLDIVNEIWWLCRFSAALNVVPAFPFVAGAATDIDWRFQLRDFAINLEGSLRSVERNRRRLLLRGIRQEVFRAFKDIQRCL